MKRITLCVPSRRRPEGAARYIESMLSLAQKPDAVDILLGVDDDDPDLEAYAKMASDRVTVSAAERCNVNSAFDRLMHQAQGDIIGWGADDLSGLTPDWDAVTRDAVGEMGFWRQQVMGHSARACAAYPFMAKAFERRIRAAQGGFVSPWFFAFWFGDTWLDDLATLLCRRHHMEWAYAQTGNGLTRGMRDLKFWGDLFVAMRPVRINAVVSILGDEAVRPMVEFIGSMVRFELAPEVYANAEALAEPEPNPFYDRQKRAAERLMAQLKAAA